MHGRTVARLASKVVRRAAVETVYHRTGANFTRPSDIRATLTERCNYRCVYCRHWRQESYAGEMALADWQAALLSIKDYVGSFAVQFLGGEPMLMPWFLDLAGFCFDHRIDWGVITNGSTLSAPRVASLIAASPLNVDVSLDSRDGTTHDFLRGVRGSMQHVTEGVERLVEARRRAEGRTIIRIKPTITRQSIGTLRGIVDWAAGMPGVMVDFAPVRLWRDEEIASLYPANRRDLDQLATEIEHLCRLKAAGAPIETSPAKLRAIIPHFEGRPSEPSVGSCRVGLRSIDIRPDGEVTHCFNFTGLGNLRHMSMEAIWTAAERRRLVAETVACPLIRTSCSTSCLSHRSVRQEVLRGIRFAKAAMS